MQSEGRRRNDRISKARKHVTYKLTCSSKTALPIVTVIRHFRVKQNDREPVWMDDCFASLPYVHIPFDSLSRTLSTKNEQRKKKGEGEREKDYLVSSQK